MNVPLILASGSPRRKMLLAEAGYAFDVDPSDVDEPEPSAGDAADPVRGQPGLAEAMAVAHRRGSGLVLGADTACAVGDEILNKPVDRADAERMIRLQEGRDTDVATGLCLARAGRGDWVGAVEVSVCRFRPWTDAEREAISTRAGGRGRRGLMGCRMRIPGSRSPRGAGPTSSACRWSVSRRFWRNFPA